MLEHYQVLVEKYLSLYNNDDVNKKIGIFAGATKPPHIGHYKAALLASEQNDLTYILISNTDREMVTPHMALEIWHIYAQTIPNLRIQISKASPIREAYELVDSLNQMINAPDTTVNLYCDADEMERYNSI